MTQRKTTVTQREVETKHYWNVMQMSLRHFREFGYEPSFASDMRDELALLSEMTESPRIRKLTKQAIALCLSYAA